MRVGRHILPAIRCRLIFRRPRTCGEPATAADLRESSIAVGQNYLSGSAAKLAVDQTGAALITGTTELSVIALGAAGHLYPASNTAILDQVDIFAPAPTTGIRCVVNAANYRGPAIAPGEIVSVFGSAIGPKQPAGTMIDSSGKVSRTLADTRLLVGGLPAPLLYVSQNQINMVVPFEIAGQTQTAIQIERNGVQESAAVSDAGNRCGAWHFHPGWPGYGQAAALNQDGTLNSVDNPADQGSIVMLFVTGAGAMTPMPVNGSAPAGPEMEMPEGCPMSRLGRKRPARVYRTGRYWSRRVFRKS